MAGCPAGFESESDEYDDYFGGDSYAKNNYSVPKSSSAASGSTGEVPQSRGGFGQAPPRSKPRNGGPPRLDNSGFGRQQDQKNAGPKSKPVFQKTRENMQNSTKTTNGTDDALKDSPSWSSIDAVLVDDFRMAVIRNNLDAVQSFLDDGLPVDTIFSTKWTALMYAAQNAQPEVVQLLLDQGADPNYNKDMYTVLMAACCSTSELEASILSCVNILLDKGAEIDAFDRYHMNALMYATKKKRATVVKRLIDAGSGVEKQDNKGHTALMLAASMGYVRIVHILLEAGADVTKQSCSGDKAADMAFVQNHKQIEELLRHRERPSQNGVATADDVTLVTEGPEYEDDDDAPEERSSQMSMKRLQSTSSQEIFRYGDLELFLTGLELPHLITVFSDHKVHFQGLLRMTDHDLQQMGIHQLGVRKKILDGIRDTHKKSWETGSINDVQYNKKITCIEAIAMVTNIKRHATYIGSSIGYIADQIKADQDILVNTQDGSGAEELAIQSEEAITNVRNLYHELVSLRTHLARVADHPHYQPADLIMPNAAKSSSSSSSTSRLKSFTALLLTAGICGLAYYKQEALSSGIRTLTDKLWIANR